MYASAMQRGKTIAAEHLKMVKPLRETVTQIRNQLVKTLMEVRQDQMVDGLRFDLPDGSSRFLTTKTNTTYRQIKRDLFVDALRFLKAKAVYQVHKDKPEMTMGQCLVEVVLAQLKLDLLRTNTQPHWTKGPPAKSQTGQQTPVLQSAPPASNI
jgi:hypothetical protein